MNKKLLQIPENGSSVTVFHTNSNTCVGIGYKRVVFGGRGPYVEFDDGQIIDRAFFIPRDTIYRFSDARIYYIEFRSNDKSFVKMYYQLSTVAYADYKIGLFYISPFDLLVDGKPVMLKNREIDKKSEEFFK